METHLLLQLFSMKFKAMWRRCFLPVPHLSLDVLLHCTIVGKKLKVLMLTQSINRFRKMQMEAPQEFQNYLVQATNYQAAQNCKTWIVGKWLSPREQRWAPRGTHFHQFVVPPVIAFRRDCTYGNLAAMRLPKDIQGLGACEYTLERGVIHACHAGGIVHLLEGWTHHEVGAIDVDRIDVVWKAATKARTYTSLVMQEAIEAIAYQLHCKILSSVLKKD